jgi:hypothetical protein
MLSPPDFRQCRNYADATLQFRDNHYRYPDLLPGDRAQAAAHTYIAESKTDFAGFTGIQRR